MTFLVLYNVNNGDMGIISVHSSVASLVRSARNHIAEQRKLTRDELPVISCEGVPTEKPANGYYIVKHNSQCACGKLCTIELYETSTTSGWVWGQNVKTTLLETYKWGSSKY